MKGEGERMLPELSEIRAKRKRIGLTQTGLAQKAGVSQSLVAKIEAGGIVPSYGNAKKIFDFFESLHEQSQLRAADFMTAKVISVRPDATLREAVKVMKRGAVSQLPVIDDGKNIGTLSEKIVLERLNSAKDMKEVSSLKAVEAMTEAMPVLREDTPFKVISALLEHNPGVLVGRKGRLVGIITKSDLLNAVLEKRRETSG